MQGFFLGDRGVLILICAILEQSINNINGEQNLKVDMPILTCKLFTFNWLTLTSEMHFVKFHPEVASCILSRGKRKCVPLGMRLLWKYIINYFLVYHLTSHFLLYLQNYKEFEAEILDLQSENMGFHLISKNILLPVEPWGMRMWSAQGVSQRPVHPSFGRAVSKVDG